MKSFITSMPDLFKHPLSRSTPEFRVKVFIVLGFSMKNLNALTRKVY